MNKVSMYAPFEKMIRFLEYYIIHILICYLYFSYVIKFVLDCDWQCYLDRYSDLQKAFGPKNVADAENHWKRHGKSEGRTCTCGSDVIL